MAAIKFSQVFLTGMRCHVLASFRWKEDSAPTIDHLRASVQGTAQLPPGPWKPLLIYVLEVFNQAVPFLSWQSVSPQIHCLRLQRPQRAKLGLLVNTILSAKPCPLTLGKSSNAWLGLHIGTYHGEHESFVVEEATCRGHRHCSTSLKDEESLSRLVVILGLRSWCSQYLDLSCPHPDSPSKGQRHWGARSKEATEPSYHPLCKNSLSW